MSEHKLQDTDISEGQMKAVTVGETDVLLCRVDGDLHAVHAKCTHYGAPLADGALSNGRVVCPWHHACFDVQNGDQLEPPGLNALQRYELRTEGGDTYITVPDDAGERTPSTAEGEDERTFVILGGGVAGENALETLRDHGFAGRLVLVTQELTPPYDRTKLSKSLGDADDEASLRLRDAGFYKERDIDIITKEVTKVNAKEKQLEFASGDPLAFDKLLVATGGVPRKLDAPGSDLKGIYNLRSLKDAQAILKAAKTGDKAVLVGSSFISLELAQSLKEQDVSVTVVAPEKVPFAKVLGERLGKTIQKNHEDNGVTFYLERKSEEFKGNGHVQQVVLDDNTELDADFVVLGIGVRPATDMLDGFEKADDGGVVVGADLQAKPDVYVAGDIAQFPYRGEQVRIEHWRLAAQHGRLAAKNMLDEGKTFEGVPYFWTAQPGLKLRYVGHAEEFDEVVFDGEPSGDFIAYYIKNNEVMAAAGSGRDTDLAALNHLMAQGRTPSVVQAKEGVDLQGLF